MTGDPLPIARRNYQAARHLAEPVADHGTRWAAGRAALADDISGIDSATAGIHLAQGRWLFDHRLAVGATEVRRSHAALALRHPRFARHVTAFTDTPLSLPETVVAAPDVYPAAGPGSGGAATGLHSNIAAFHAGDVLGAMALCPHTDRLCEIGGGYGAAARLWLDNPIRQPSLYVLLDFPESLFFAELFLRLSLPQAEHRYLLATAEADGLQSAGSPGRPTIAYVPLALAEVVADLPFDLFLNSAGFQEYGAGWLDFYRALLDGARCTRLFSHNLCLTPVGATPERITLFAPRLGPCWVPRRVTYAAPLDVVQSVRFAAEILFERQAEPPRQLFQRLLHVGLETGLDHAALIRLLYLAPDDLPDDWLHRLVHEALEFLGYLPSEVLHLLRRQAARAAASGRPLSPGLQAVSDSLETDAARMLEAARVAARVDP
ncbi:MAG: putative sugar O-methyltransferase [Sneathiellaceae bacterium]